MKTFLLVLSLVVFAFASKRCDIGCTKEYFPICGVDKDGNYQTFGNACMMDRANCPKYRWELAYEGECEKCNFHCQEIYKPVCAVDDSGNYRTFGNECELRSVNCPLDPLFQWMISYEGECKNCNIACTFDYHPVCAVDGKGNQQTFGNTCALAAANCPEAAFSFVHDGECTPCSC